MTWGYSKLFGSILDSSIWQESKETKLLWVTMLAMKDRDGIVEASVPGIARRAGITVDEALAGLKVLLAPDRWSRTPDHDGRRIEEIPGGWRVLNHDIYRDRLDTDEMREKARTRKQRQRERKADRKVARGSRDVTLGHARSRDVPPGHAPSPHTDTKTDTGSGSLSGSGLSSQPSDPDLGGGADLGRPAAPEWRTPPGADIGQDLEALGRARAPVVRPSATPPNASAEDARVRQRLVERFRVAISEARRAVADRHGLKGVRCDLPLHGGENETELRQCLRDAGDRAAGDLEHVIAVATAEALASKNGEGIRWLGWSLGRSRAWNRALQTTAAIAGDKQDKSVFDVVDEAVAAIEGANRDPE